MNLGRRLIVIPWLLGSLWLVGADSPKWVRIKGNSLSGIVENSQILPVQEIKHLCIDDVVIVRVGGKLFAKIVKALPGDTFALKDIRKDCFGIQVNGRWLKNSFDEIYCFPMSRKKMLQLYEKDYGNKVPEDAVMVLGNLASGSYDSVMFGLVSIEDIEGKLKGLGDGDRCFRVEKGKI